MVQVTFPGSKLPIPTLRNIPVFEIIVRLVYRASSLIYDAIELRDQPFTYTCRACNVCAAMAEESLHVVMQCEGTYHLKRICLKKSE